MQSLVQRLLVNLPVRTIITLDEFHFLFSNLDADEVEKFGLYIRDLMLNPELPCQFVVTGSTHVLLQIAIDESARNGIHLHNAVRLELPLDETSVLEGGVTKELANHFKVSETEVVTV
jgi:hypothetical protein